MLDAPKLARMAGLSVHTVRAALYGRREPEDGTREKLAYALREYSIQAQRASLRLAVRVSREREG